MGHIGSRMSPASSSISAGRTYLGPSLYGMLNAPFPPQLRKGDRVRRYSQFTGTIADTLRYLRKTNQFGRRERLRSQH